MLFLFLNLKKVHDTTLTLQKTLNNKNSMILYIKIIFNNFTP